MRSAWMLVGLLALGGCGSDGNKAKPGTLEHDIKETAESLGEAVGEVAEKAGATAKEIATDLKDAPDEASRNFKKNFKGDPAEDAPGAAEPDAEDAP